MTTTYRICTTCIMDTSDPDISFDERGICSHCHRYNGIIQSETYKQKKQPGALEKLLEEIKKRGKGKTYDCIIGVSGGVDSTYVAYLTKQFGLRPLAVHLDNGWNSELAVSNIEKLLETLGINLFTHVIDWDEFRDLQLSFLKASTPDSEIPTDHAIVALLYQTAVKQNIKFILGGTNTATEGGGVPSWSQGHGDWKYIKSIQKIFGSKTLKSFPHYGPFKLLYLTSIKRIRWIDILDYIDYDKKKAMESLITDLGWKDYGAKHFESIYTRFYQGCILPNKFGFNKKRLHLSSLVWSGQLPRDEALLKLSETDYPQDLQEADKEYVQKKLVVSKDEYEEIMRRPPKSIWDYPSYKKLISNKHFISIYHFLKRR